MTQNALVVKLRKISTVIYIAVEESVADDISATCRAAADRIEAAEVTLAEFKETIAQQESNANADAARFYEMEVALKAAQEALASRSQSAKVSVSS